MREGICPDENQCEKRMRVPAMTTNGANLTEEFRAVNPDPGKTMNRRYQRHHRWCTQRPPLADWVPGSQRFASGNRAIRQLGNPGFHVAWLPGNHGVLVPPVAGLAVDSFGSGSMRRSANPVVRPAVSASARRIGRPSTSRRPRRTPGRSTDVAGSRQGGLASDSSRLSGEPGGSAGQSLLSAAPS